MVSSKTVQSDGDGENDGAATNRQTPGISDGEEGQSAAPATTNNTAQQTARR